MPECAEFSLDARWQLTELSPTTLTEKRDIASTRKSGGEDERASEREREAGNARKILDTRDIVGLIRIDSIAEKRE